MEILWIIGVLFLMMFGQSAAQNPCSTPNRMRGTCIPIQQCSQLQSYLASPSRDDQEFLRRSQCGYHGFTSYVCCPSFVATATTTSTTARPLFNQYQYQSSQQNDRYQLPNGRPSSSSSSTRFTESDLPRPGQCGIQTDEKIYGGVETSIEEFPWMALVHYKRGRSGGFFCGGALINENYVLTAAHCVQSTSITRSGYRVDSVRLGEHNLLSDEDCEEGECADPPLDVNIAGDPIVHEEYEPESAEQSNDIALLRLENPIRYTDYIRPICLPVARHLRNKNFDGSPLVVAGFGKTENKSRSDVKMKLEVDGFNLKECEDIYSYLEVTLNSKHLCAGGKEGRDSCSGDSGGPLMGRDLSDSRNPYFYLAGLVSFGPAQCGIKGFPGVYTRVNQHIEWILSHMRK